MSAAEKNMSVAEKNGDQVVLIVDDDIGIQTLMRVLLERNHYQVEIAGDGVEALGKLSNGVTYSAILLDLMMPKMNGFELLTQLRALPAETLRRTIVFTAASESTLRGLDGTGIFRVIRKPFDIHALVSAVCDCAQSH